MCNILAAPDFLCCILRVNVLHSALEILPKMFYSKDFPCISLSLQLVLMLRWLRKFHIWMDMGTWRLHTYVFPIDIN